MDPHWTDAGFLLLPAFAVAQCPDYTSPVTTPAFTKPAKKAFRNFGNTIMASIYKPWHMVHDEIVKAGTPVQMVGKFDYDAVLHKDLEGEYVHVYVTGTGTTATPPRAASFDSSGASSSSISTSAWWRTAWATGCGCGWAT